MSSHEQLRLVLDDRPGLSFQLFDQILRVVSDNRAVPTLHEAVAFLVALDATSIGLAETSVPAYRRNWSRFVRFARAHGVTSAADVDGPFVQSFVDAPMKSGELPSPSERRGRLNAVSKLFSELGSFCTVVDPTTGVVVPTRRNEQTYRPLSEPELERCHGVIEGVILAPRYGPVFAAAEAGCSDAEVGHVANCDVDGGTLEAPGDRKREARSLVLTDWGFAAIEEWRATTRPSRDSLLCGLDDDATYDSRRTTVGAVLREILKRAGLWDLPGVDNRSISAAAAVRAFVVGTRIEDAARLLGVRSLDRAAAIIGFDWSET